MSGLGTPWAAPPVAGEELAWAERAAGLAAWTGAAPAALAAAEAEARALIEQADYAALPPRERRACFAAALLGATCSGSTPWARARRARGLLYDGELPWREREAICGLLAWEELPWRASESEGLERRLRRAALSVSLDALSARARARARAASPGEQGDLLAELELFEEALSGLEPAPGPGAFADAWSRFRYFRDPSRAPGAVAYDETQAEVVLTSGPPGAGKSRWCATHLDERPRIELDALRAELGVSPREDQGPVVAAARERARAHLRAGRSFAWDGTYLSRDLRRAVVDLCDSYRARVRLVCCEAPASVARARNAARARPVPAGAVARMLARWEFPDPAEAWEVEVIETG